MELPTEPPPDMATDATLPPAPPRQPGFWNAIGVIVLYFALQLAAGIAAAVVVGIGLAVEADAQGRRLDSAAITQWLQAPGGKILVTAIALLIAAAVTLWLIRHWWPAQWRGAWPPGFGFVAPDDRWFFLWAVLVGFAVALAGSFLTTFIAHGHPVQQDVTQLGSHAAPGMRVLLAFVTVCVAPVVEEAVFRGVLLSGLMRSVPAVWAVVISAVIFGGVHYPDFKFVWYPLPALVLVGLVLGWIRLRSRSLWPSITLHAANNLVAVVGWFVIAGAHAHG